MKLFSYKVEIYLGAVLGWVDITADVQGSVSIKRGRTSDGGRAEPGRCSLRLDNLSGNYSPRNPAGAWYGLLGRNTPLRVSAGPAGGPLTGRFYGEVSEWPPRWNLRGTVRYVDVEAAGVLRRLGQGEAPKLSPLRRTIAASGPVAYYPGEDGGLAGVAGSAVAGQYPLTVSGPVTFAAVENPGATGTGPLADLAAGGSLAVTFTADVIAATADKWTVHVVGDFDLFYTSTDIVLMEWTTPGGTYTRWQLVEQWVAGHTQVIAYDRNGVATVVVDRNGAAGGFRTWVVSAEQVGGNIVVTYRMNADFTFTGTVPGTLGGVASMRVNPTRTTSTRQMPFGHLAVWAATDVPYQWDAVVDSYGGVVWQALAGYLGEPAHARLARVCAEEGIPLTVTAPPAPLVSRMGPQPAATYAELLDQAVDVDGGYLYEQRGALGLAYRTRASLYNQATTPIAYTGQLASPFHPVDDADDVRNDVTAKRTNGSSARVVKSTGRLAALPPPAGVGVYRTEVELNLLSDVDLPYQAGWRVHRGTVDQPRYPSLSVNLAAPEWQAAPAALAALLAVDTGGVLEVSGLPPWAAGDARTMVLGYAETVDEYEWQITFAGVPAQPWDVGTIGGPARAAGTGGTLAAAVTATGLSLSLATPAGGRRWTTNPAHFPLDLLIGAERVTVSAITGAASPQTATVSARSVNGVTAAWPAGTPVQPWRPAVAAL